MTWLKPMENACLLWEQEANDQLLTPTVELIYHGHDRYHGHGITQSNTRF